MDHFQERLVATTGRLSPRSEGEAVRRTAEMLEQLARASAAESGETWEPAVSYRELMDRGQRATGLRQEEIRDALARLENDGEVACGPRKEGERPWQQMVRVLKMERLGRRTASRMAAWSSEERPPEPAYLDLGEAGEALGLTPEAVLDGLLTGELPASAVRLRASVLGLAP